MNTTPSISDVSGESGPYTVIGGESLDRERRDLPGMSIVLLNRGSRPFRRDLFDQLARIGVREVISIESSPCPYDVDALSRRHERLRFLVFTGSPSTGAMIDAAIREALSAHIFVLQSDMKINTAAISSRVFDKIAERGRLCTVPTFRDDGGEVLPTVFGPVSGRGGLFEVQPVTATGGELPTLLPWDYAGIYRRDRHLALGGFDARIVEPWWQKLEYGVRAWLWGEQIVCHPSLRVGYTGEMAPEDTSPGEGYRRFYLKTLAVRRRGDCGHLGRAGWWSYLRSSGDSSIASKGSWKEIRRWVRSNRYRYRRDAADLVGLWDWTGGA